MKTSVMSVFTVSETKAYNVLSARVDGKMCLKKAIAAVMVNNTGRDLHFSTVMTSGKVEAENAVLPAGYAAVVQPDGELNVQVDPKGRPTHGKLYDLDNQMTPTMAHQMAVMRGLTIPMTTQVTDAYKLFVEDVDPRQLPWCYAVSKGRVKPFRCGLKFELPKAGWGSIQVAEIDSSIVVNVITNECYYIGRDELVRNWVLEENQGLNATDFWSALPVIGNDDFGAMLDS